MKTILDYLVGLNRKTSILTSQEKLRSHVRMGWGEAGTGVMGPQAENTLEPPESGRGKQGFSSRAFRGSVALQTP